MVAQRQVACGVLMVVTELIAQYRGRKQDGPAREAVMQEGIDSWERDTWGVIRQALGAAGESPKW